jgi:fatty acid desaturase
VTLYPLSHYAREIRRSLPESAFLPQRSRLAWLALHVVVIGCGTAVLALLHPPVALALLTSLVIGHSFAGLAFVGHETMHGAVVRAQGWRYLVGFVSFLPFTLPPRLWVAWHNKVHHGNTMKVGVDPDAYPTLEEYRSSLLKRIADYLSVGIGRWAGTTTLLIGFTGQSTQIMWRLSRKEGYLSPREHNLAILERLLAVGIWVSLGLLIGPRAFVYAFAVPLVVANVVVISYILTNHSLSPLTEVNDPLVNSLSVTAHPIIEKLHLNFGLHVEHHLFPSMSSQHAPLVRDLLVARWPERYQSLPLFTALGRLYTTPRVYRTETVLVDPVSGREAEAIVPSEPSLRMSA